MKQTLASGLLGAVGAMTAYLVLERSHAEEIGGGSRVFAEVVRGERPLAAPTWLALAAVAVTLAVAGRNRAEVPVRARRGR